MSRQLRVRARCVKGTHRNRSRAQGINCTKTNDIHAIIAIPRHIRGAIRGKQVKQQEEPKSGLTRIARLAIAAGALLVVACFGAAWNFSGGPAEAAEETASER